jgi:hypothetical protein
MMFNISTLTTSYTFENEKIAIASLFPGARKRELASVKSRSIYAIRFPVKYKYEFQQKW